MNFGWFDDNTPQAEVRSTTLHEFGHALGLIHEHQSPTAGINWNKEVVYQDMAGQGWSRAKVDQHIFKKYSTREITNYSAFDLSIDHGL